MTIDPTVHGAASSALGAGLSQPELLDSPNLVFRAKVDDGRSVVVKRVLMTEWNRGDGTESEQLLNEWCVLEHLGGVVSPKLLAADRKSSLIVIEDFGDRRTVEKALLDDTTSDARSMLSKAGAALAHMHEAGVGRESEFLEAQRAKSTFSPRSDSTVDFRIERRDLFEEVFSVLDVDVHPRFWEEIVRLEVAVHDGDLFRTLIHADAGPQNFLIGDETKMIDFEFGVYLNAMCDLGGARGGFPQTEHAAWVDPSDAGLFQDAYRSVAAEFWPQVEHDVFDEHLLMGTGHWALNRLAGGWRAKLRSMVAGESQADDAVSERRQYATLWTLFCENADAADLLGPLSDTLRSALTRFEERFPDMVPLDAYPALAE